MRSLTFCKLTSFKINCFAHIAYIGSFTDYHRRIFACVGFITHTTLRVLSCVALSISQKPMSQTFRNLRRIEPLRTWPGSQGAGFECKCSVQKLTYDGTGSLQGDAQQSVCGKTSEARPISLLHPSCVIVLPKCREKEKGTEPLQPTPNPFLAFRWLGSLLTRICST